MPLVLVLLASCSAGETPDSAVIKIGNPASENGRLPYLVTDSSNNLYLSWVEDAGNEKTVLKYARRSNGRWFEPGTIAGGSDWFVNWADFPSITAEGGRPIAAHWLQKTPGGTYSYEVRMSLADPETGRWSTGITPHTDETATEHGFVSMLPWGREQILAVWLDGRRTEKRTPRQYGDLTQAMTLRSAVITTDGHITEKNLIDTSVCDCCQTSLARTGTGAVAAYRNRTDGEVRDIYVSRYREGKWSDSVPVHRDNWNIGGCPVNGPSIAASGDTLLVAWFTGAGETNRVMAAFSVDGGATFNEPERVDEGTPMGRVDAVIVGSGRGVVSWMEKSGAQARLKARGVDAAGNAAGSSVTIALMDPSRRSGFPQMELVDGRLVFAWTQPGERSRIKMAQLPAYAL